ncbi:hypothetical protein ACI2KR_06885 [Pseudomonas luteola]
MPNAAPHILANYTSQDTIEIISMAFFEHLRDTEAGRVLYEEWESALPKEVQLITLFAENDNTADFWKSMGFEFIFHADDQSDIPYESRYKMFKGVNGKETPSGEWWNPHEEY